MKVLIYIIISLFVFAVIIFGCNENTLTSNREVIFPDSLVSYQNHVQPFLNMNCAYQGCHSAETMAGGRKMTDYFSLFDTYNIGLIFITKPEQSRLVTVMKNNPPHLGQFYFPKGYFNDNQINGILTWIKEGAKNN